MMTGIEEVELDEKLAVSCLVPYVEARDAATSAKKDQDRLGELIKKWLEQHAGEVVYDGEAGLEARLQERRLPGRPCDLNALLDAEPHLLAQLIRNGCLKVDEAAVKRAGALAGGVERYLGPAGVTHALIVEAKR